MAAMLPRNASMGVPWTATERRRDTSSVVRAGRSMAIKLTPRGLPRDPGSGAAAGLPGARAPVHPTRQAGLLPLERRRRAHERRARERRADAEGEDPARRGGRETVAGVDHERQWTRDRIRRTRADHAGQRLGGIRQTDIRGER